MLTIREACICYQLKQTQVDKIGQIARSQPQRLAPMRKVAADVDP